MCTRAAAHLERVPFLTRAIPPSVVLSEEGLATIEANADRLLAEVFAGQRPLRVFRMMKMYNDPTMNPYLYKARGQAAA